MILGPGSKASVLWRAFKAPIPRSPFPLLPELALPHDHLQEVPQQSLQRLLLRSSLRSTSPSRHGFSKARDSAISTLPPDHELRACHLHKPRYHLGRRLRHRDPTQADCLALLHHCVAKHLRPWHLLGHAHRGRSASRLKSRARRYRPPREAIEGRLLYGA